MGTIITFYSYKGGVGRSMALANIAYVLASEGRKVLVVDWDLEAPGIERYFKQYAEIEGDGVGLLTMLADIEEGQVSPFPSYCLSVRIASAHNLVLLPSGRGNDPEGYSRALEHFNWPRFFRRGGGHRLEALREEWKAEFDFVLVDSRTGLSDSGGICTIQLPDVVVAMFTANEQSLLGVRDVMRYARRARQALPFTRMQLAVIPVPSRSGFPSSASRRPGFAGLQRSSTSSSRTGCLGALTLPISSNGSRSRTSSTSRSASASRWSSKERLIQSAWGLHSAR